MFNKILAFFSRLFKSLFSTQQQSKDTVVLQENTTIQELHTKVKSEVKEGVLSIKHDTFSSTNIQSIFENYGISEIKCQVTSVGEISGGTFTVSNSSVDITANGNVLPNLSGTSSLVFSIDNEETQFAMTFTLTSPWKLSDTFTLLKDTFVDKQPFAYNKLILASTPPEATLPGLWKSGFFFTGSLPTDTSFLKTLAALFPSLSDLSLDGFILSLNPQTTVNMKSHSLAIVGVKSLQFKDTYFTIEETTNHDIPEGEPWHVPDVQFCTELDIGHNIKIDVTGNYPMLSNVVDLKGTIDGGLSLTGGLFDLSNLFGDSNLVDALPESIKKIGDDISLQAVGCDFYLDKLSELFSASVTINVTKLFQLFPSIEILKVESLELTWVVFNPFDSKSRNITFYSVCDVKIGNKYEVEIQIGELNLKKGAYMSIASRPGQTLCLPDLLGEFHVPKDLIPSITIEQFQFYADFGEKNYSFSIACKEDWKPIPDFNLALTETLFSCDGAEGSSFAASAQATFTIPNTESKFTIEAIKGTGWQFNGSYIGGNITIAELLDDLASGWGVNKEAFPKVFNDIIVHALSISISTEPKTFTFHLDSTIKVLDKDLDLYLGISLEKVADIYDFSLSGKLLIAGELFELEIDDKKEQTSLFAKWSADGGSPLDINHILSHLGLSAITIPDKVNLALSMKSIGFSYNSLNKQVSMELTNTDNLTALFGTETIDGSAKFFFALKLGEAYSLSHLCSELDFINGITLKELFVAISDFTDENFQIPSTPYKGITEGVDFRAQLSMASKHDTGLGKAVNFLGQSFGASTLDIGVNLGKSDFELIGKLVGIDIPFISSSEKIFTLNDIGLTIKSTPPTIELDCDINLDFDFQATPPVNSVHIRGSIAFIVKGEEVAIQLSVYEDTKISQPFKIPILTINNLGFAIAGVVGPLAGIEFTIQGDIALGDPASTEPIHEKFGASIAYEDDVVNIPYLQSDTTGGVTISKIWNACFPTLPIPSYLDIIEIQELNFYFCDEPVTLPSGQMVSIGTSFLAAFSIWNFHTFCNLVISPTKIAGKLEMDPLDLKIEDTTVVTIKGNGQGDPEYHIKPGGAKIDFDTGKLKFDATLIATFLGLEESVQASMSTSGFEFSLQSHLLLDTGFSCTMKDMESFAASFKYGTDFTVSLPTKLGHALGSIHIHDTIHAGLSVSVKPTDIKFTCDGGFDLQGLIFDFGPFTVNVSITSVEDMLKAIEQFIKDHVEEIFKKLIDDGALWAKWVTDKIIEGAEDVAGVLKEVYGYGKEELTKLLHDLNYGADYIARALKDLFDADEKEIAHYLSLFFSGGVTALALEGLGYGANEIAGALQSVGKDINGIADSLSQAGFGGEIIGGALKFIGFNIDAIAGALKFIGLGADAIASIFKTIGYGAEEAIRAIGSFFTDITPSVFNDIMQGVGYASEEVESAFKSIGGTFASFAKDLWDDVEPIINPTKW